MPRVPAQGSVQRDARASTLEEIEKYNEAMSRHGHDSFSKEDERVVRDHLERRGMQKEQIEQIVGEEAIGKWVEDGEVVETVSATGTADDDYDSWTNDDLREELEERQLPISGNKFELITRLRENDASRRNSETGGEA
jgi:hypothetical protein